MKNIIIFLVTFILLHSTETLAKTQYFAHLMFQETPYSPYVGIHPLSKAQALNRVHYRFEYDDKERVVGIKSYVGGNPASYFGSFDTYYWFSAGLNIEYHDNHEVHYYLDGHGNNLDSTFTPHHAVYTLDEMGQRTQLRYYSKDKAEMPNRLGAHRYTWSLSEDGLVIENRFDVEGEAVRLRPDFEFYETRFKFKASGVVQFMYNYGLDGKPTNNSTGAGIDRIFYDLAGNFIRWQVYDKDGKPVEGNGPKVHTGEYLYNDKGDKLAVRFFDRFGYPMESSDGLHMAANYYNVTGSFEKEIQYDVQGNITQIHVREFNPSKTRISWDRFYDGQNSPKENPYFGGAAAINYIYDESGKMKERRHYNKALAFFDPFK